MKQCQSCGRKNYNHEKYCPVCHYYLGNVKEEANNIVYNKPKTKPTIECPYCHSTDTKKITNTSKAVHTALFGIWSMGRNSKNYHCNSCGSDF